MRVNVYHEELTKEVEVVHVEPREGHRFIGLRLLLESSPKLHHEADDDDRSAVTVWVGSHKEGYDLLLQAMQALERDEQGDDEPAEPEPVQ